MSRFGVRCTSCFAAALAALCGLWTLGAYASDTSGLGSISNEFWLGLLFTVMFALLGAYVEGLKSGFERRHNDAEKRDEANQKRIASLEYDFRQQGTQIGLIRETMVKDHPTREETSEYREEVREELRYIRDRVDEMARRR